MKNAWGITGYILNLRGCIFCEENSDAYNDVSRIAQAKNIKLNAFSNT
jgi:hypothetical protein